ncbi:hypothetical protein UU5_11580 [Rhodanobacter sp. 115]|nr:hypothetical protein UU5_11580 [Rhodanobacter sp. 115]
MKVQLDRAEACMLRFTMEMRAGYGPAMPDVIVDSCSGDLAMVGCCRLGGQVRESEPALKAENS